MEVADLERVIDDLGNYLLEVNITNYGEPFLNKDLYSMIRYMKRKGIKVNIGSNGHFFNDLESVQEFVLTGIDDIYISLDGVSQETYERYRVGGDFKKVVTGLKLLVKTRNELKSSTPFIELQFLVMKHNEHEVPQIREIAEDIGVDRLILKPVSFNVSEWEVPEIKERFKAFMPRDEKYRLYKINNNDLEWKEKIQNRCDYLWRGTVVLCDGSIVPCCLDPSGDMVMGNVRDGIKNVWNSEKYTALRKQILKDKSKLSICRYCLGT